ncbi:hypothetical protein HAX54_006990 [Datura stramonium]|uniref:MORF/ORRM1/DAG-like MORF domain-containing protein n=1 Tax=Datura stramonium TaxID=4076 RepID=A0ABS8TB50_DATST|nr:hypothetical protein [Datura stramonium]
MKIYSVSTRHYYAFGALVSEELSYKLKELPRVRWVLPDSYLDVKNKDYGVFMLQSGLSSLLVASHLNHQSSADCWHLGTLSMGRLYHMTQKYHEEWPNMGGMVQQPTMGGMQQQPNMGGCSSSPTWEGHPTWEDHSSPTWEVQLHHGGGPPSNYGGALPITMVQHQTIQQIFNTMADQTVRHALTKQVLGQPELDASNTSGGSHYQNPNIPSKSELPPNTSW